MDSNLKSPDRHVPRQGPAKIEADLLAKFAAIVGPKHAIADPAEQQRYVMEERGLYRGRTPMVLRPGSVAEVAAILRLANETGTPLVPQGGNTGLVGGQIPHNGEILLSLTRLDEIREIDPVSNTMTCEAGVVLAKAQEAARTVNRLFPLSLGAQGSCTIGGNLSTNAGGVAVLAYGTARDLVLGLEVVLSDGQVWNGLSKLRKDNTGYDLKDLFVGAEGTLGVITAAVLKLFPQPRAIETAFVGLSSPRVAVALLSLVQDHLGPAVTSFELMPRLAIEFSLRHGTSCRDPLGSSHPWYVLVEVSALTPNSIRGFFEDVLATALAQGLISDAVIAANLDQARSFWHLRETLPENQKPEGGSIKHDISVPVAAVPDFIAEASAALETLIPGCRPLPFGHVGDGNIHFNVTQPQGADKAAFLARWGEVNALVHGIVAKFGGSISAEHGIGKLKRNLLPAVKDPVAMQMMRTLKATFDPNGILNPGKVL